MTDSKMFEMQCRLNAAQEELKEADKQLAFAEERFSTYRKGLIRLRKTLERASNRADSRALLHDAQNDFLTASKTCRDEQARVKILKQEVIALRRDLFEETHLGILCRDVRIGVKMIRARLWHALLPKLRRLVKRDEQAQKSIDDWNARQRDFGSY